MFVNPCLPSQGDDTVKNAEAIAKIHDKWVASNPDIKAFGYDDFSTMQHLYAKYNRGKQLDPLTQTISTTDIERFRIGLEEFSSSLGKKENLFTRWFKLPTTIASRVPEGQLFAEGMANAHSFRQKEMKEAGINLNKILTDGLFKMSFDGKYLNKKWLKKYGNLEKRMEDATTPDAIAKARADIQEMLASKGPDGIPVGAKVLDRFNDLMTFNTQPQGPAETKIVREWNDLRERSAKLMLGGINQGKAIIKTVNNVDTRRDLMRAMEHLEGAAARVLFQSKTDANLPHNEAPLFALSSTKPNGKPFKVFNSETGIAEPYKVMNEHGEMAVPTHLSKYAPVYVIEMANSIKQLTDYASSPKDVKWKGKSSDQIAQMIEESVDLGKMINRLKNRSDIDNSYFSSKDPVFYLNKYVADVAHFNYTTRVNLEYKKAVDKLQKAVRYGEVNNAEAIGDYARYMGDILTEIRDSGFNNYEGSLSSMDGMVRMINGIEFISKLGYGIRGGLRNVSQKVLEWSRFGTRAYGRARKFYAERDNVDLYNEQMARYGYKFGEKTKLATTAAGTAGSVEASGPAGTIMTAEGGLKRADVPLTVKMAEKIGVAAEKSSVFMTGAENLNRGGTMRIAFSEFMLNFEQNPEFYRAQYMKEFKATAPPNDKVLRAYAARQGGNAAFKSVGDLHFHYEQWAKAKVLQTPVGKVVGQFQTYRFALWDLQWKMLRDANRARKAGKYNLFETDASGKAVRIMPEIQEAMRYASAYALVVPVLSVVTNSDIGNLVQNETYDTFSRFYTYLTSDETDPDQLEDKYGMFFGKPALLANLGPFVSDLATFGDLMDWWNATPEELQETMKMTYDPDDPDWWYKMARIFTVQGSRTAWHTIPALLEDQYERAFRVETGLYKPRHLSRWLKDTKHEGFPFKGDKALDKERRTWLDESPLSPKQWMYTGKYLPKIKGKKKKVSNELMNTLDRMLEGTL